MGKSRPPEVNRRISVGELKKILSNPKTSWEDVSRYIIEERSRPFSISLKPNPETVQIPQTFAPMALKAMAPEAKTIATDEQRMFAPGTFDEVMDGVGKVIIVLKNAIFAKKMREGYTGPIIVSEGDSWFMSTDTGIVHQLIMQHDLAIFCVEMWGDTIENMAGSSEYIQAIQEKSASVLLLSGGGNDIFGGEYLADFDPSLSAPEHLLPKYSELLDNAMAHYDHILQRVEELPGDVSIICHGYDYVVPNSEAWPCWLGPPMNEHGITDRGFQALIAREMIDQFNDRLKLLVERFDNVTYLDLRGIVGPNRWFDEIHPTKAAYADIAAMYKAEIDRLTSPL